MSSEQHNEAHIIHLFDWSCCKGHFDKSLSFLNANNGGKTGTEGTTTTTFQTTQMLRNLKQELSYNRS